MPRLPVTDCLIDACALLAYFRREEGRDVVKDLLDRTERGEIRLFMNVINQVEVFYDCIRKVGLDRANDAFAMVDDLPITIIDTVERSEAEHAARLKAEGGMSLADTFLVATAMRTGATLVTADWAELEVIADKGVIPFLWIRPKPEPKPEKPAAPGSGLRTIVVDQFSAEYLTAQARAVRLTPAEVVHALVRRAIAGADEGQDGEEPPQPGGGEDSVSHKKLFP
jgi:predicted nucleic acid-binding protein